MYTATISKRIMNKGIDSEVKSVLGSSSEKDLIDIHRSFVGYISSRIVMTSKLAKLFHWININPLWVVTYKEAI